jgi:hypothetical protein
MISLSSHDPRIAEGDDVRARKTYILGPNIKETLV